MHQILGSSGIIYLNFDDKLNNILTNYYNILCSHIGVYYYVDGEGGKVILTSMYENISILSEWIGPYVMDDILNNKKIKNNSGIHIKISKIIISRYANNNEKIFEIFEKFVESEEH